MSEINSIAQGTYTLGQTSATTYQAGPGISITQPSEGTVRISNDETVLWSGDKLLSSGTTFNFFEPLSAFERVQLYVARGTDARLAKCNEFFTSGLNNMTFHVENSFLEGSKLWWDMADININGTSARVITNIRKTITTTIADNGAGSPLTLNYAVGINRISGGNA